MLYIQIKEDVTLAVWDDTRKNTLVCAVVTVKIQGSSRTVPNNVRYYPRLRQVDADQHPLLVIFNNALDSEVKEHIEIKE